MHQKFCVQRLSIIALIIALLKVIRPINFVPSLPFPVLSTVLLVLS